MSDEDEGLPLMEALRTFCDPQLVATHESARARLERIPPRPSWFHSSRWELEAWSDRYEAAQPAARHAADRAWAALVAEFKERLRSRELVMTGMEMPLTRDSKLVVIPAPLRSALLLDFNGSSAKRGTLEFIDVRVRRLPLDSLSDRDSADPVEQDGNELAGAAAEGTADPPPPSADTGRRGRGQPNLKKQIEAELERRAAQGQLSELQAEEFRSLEVWASEEQKKGRLPKHRVPKARSIEKSLAKRYQELKAKKSMR